MWKSLILSARQGIQSASSSRSLPTIPRPATQTRAFVVVPRMLKDADTRDFDREKLNPVTTEATETATHDEIAQHDTAFDPSTTMPERELEATEQESRTKGEKGTLNVSAANKDVSKWRDAQEGGPSRNADREASSQRGHPNKGSKIDVKEDGTHVSRH
ncbi:hypothetical protein POX_a01185 [Penicillium oxalicum]|uniref:Uncharacterized protein n=1 Tax=Penicillium oxalicum (strain 114-2 / CGMCC 5302) TaxID=933388 RepID=S8B4T2_PENO1|nr:hypothetical protein POX_a01185 [Penicillium oxalicum]EPS33823.1 hypothetical protein PDE_08785 [Penicillium oxalicum 114-2]KAI2794586.1 hypothetical protein POX_a01185 [Penicillium oxalicum]